MSENNLWQIADIKEDDGHAGTKATNDFSKIAERLGYRLVPIKMATAALTKSAAVKRQLRYIGEWNRAYKTIPAGATVLLQQPFQNKEVNRNKVLRKLKAVKHVKYLTVVHDVEELRGYRYNEYYKQDYELMLELADVLIVHNDSMKEWFVSRGVSEKNIVVLEIFDYLHNMENQAPSFEKGLSVAGNLDTEKCAYIKKLSELENIDINLYGVNYDHTMDDCPNVEYKGAFPADKLPGEFRTGFGLVWDGQGIDGCTGQSGEYLRYNNPHKLSLYLSSGLPVVIWSEAAEAEFVKREKAGICISSLRDLGKVLDSINAAEYDEMAKNAKIVGEKLKKGSYGEKALKTAMDILEEIYANKQ